MPNVKKTFEVEIKSLLGSKENADRLKSVLMKKYPSTKLLRTEKQLNHYFNAPKDLHILAAKARAIIPEEKQDAFDHILTHGQKISIRTRDANGKVLLVIKASLGSDTSSNGIARAEFEAAIPMKLADLDRCLLEAGCSYQAKWSRERKEYGNNNMHVCIDRNAGYGYLAEFEKMSDDERSLDIAKSQLVGMMKNLGVLELPQDRLERMFAHYNAHWPEYYGTDKIFIVE